MKKKLCMLFAIVLLLVGGCNEKSQNYFTGTILKITDNYFIVSPDDSEPIRETSDNILVPKEVVSANGVPELAVGERIQVVYNEMELTDEGVIIDKPINVKWGNYSQIKCEMLLFKEAFECPVNFDYYHLLSGVDLPLYLIRFNTYIVFSNCIKVLFLLLLMRIV